MNGYPNQTLNPVTVSAAAASSNTMPFASYQNTAQDAATSTANNRYSSHQHPAHRHSAASGLSTVSPHMGNIGMYDMYAPVSNLSNMLNPNAPEVGPEQASGGLIPPPGAPAGTSLRHGGMVGLDGMYMHQSMGAAQGGPSVVPLSSGLPGVGINGAPIHHHHHQQHPSALGLNQGHHQHQHQHQHPHHQHQHHQHQHQPAPTHAYQLNAPSLPAPNTPSSSAAGMSSYTTANSSSNNNKQSARSMQAPPSSYRPKQEASSAPQQQQAVAPAAAAANAAESADPQALQHPTYIGYIKTAVDAILLLTACDYTISLGPNHPSNNPDSASSPSSSKELADDGLPRPRRVTRRLLDGERASLIHSGSIFVWDEKEAGMRRWTDGRCWSASRVSGCFLTYRELEGKKKTPAQAALIAAQTGKPTTGGTSNTYKIDGLIKQSFSITTLSGRKLHIISYFTKRDVRESRLRKIHEDPHFRRALLASSGLFANGGGISFPLPSMPSAEPVSKKARSSSSSASKGKNSNGNGSGIDDSDLDGGVVQWAEFIDENEYQDPTSRSGPDDAGDNTSEVPHNGGDHNNRSGDEGSGAGAGGGAGGAASHNNNSNNNSHRQEGPSEGGGGQKRKRDDHAGNNGKHAGQNGYAGSSSRAVYGSGMAYAPAPEQHAQYAYAQQEQQQQQQQRERERAISPPAPFDPYGKRHPSQAAGYANVSYGGNHNGGNPGRSTSGSSSSVSGAGQAYGNGNEAAQAQAQAQWRSTNHGTGTGGGSGQALQGFHRSFDTYGPGAGTSQQQGTGSPKTQTQTQTQTQQGVRTTLPSLTTLNSSLRGGEGPRGLAGGGSGSGSDAGSGGGGGSGSGSGSGSTLASLPPGRPPFKRRLADGRPPSSSSTSSSTTSLGPQGNGSEHLPPIRRPTLGRRKRSSSSGGELERLGPGRLPTLKSLRGRRSPSPVRSAGSGGSNSGGEREGGVRLPPLSHLGSRAGAYRSISGSGASASFGRGSVPPTPTPASASALEPVRRGSYLHITESSVRDDTALRSRSAENLMQRGGGGGWMTDSASASATTTAGAGGEPISRSPSRAEQISAVGALLSLKSGSASAPTSAGSQGSGSGGSDDGSFLAGTGRKGEAAAAPPRGMDGLLSRSGGPEEVSKTSMTPVRSLSMISSNSGSGSGSGSTSSHERSTSSSNGASTSSSEYAPMPATPADGAPLHARGLGSLDVDPQSSGKMEAPLTMVGSAAASATKEVTSAATATAATGDSRYSVY
ncbi:unnamed protein product [Tilletia controversa]|nr:unnamed protein product [Tilletia controversa]CAD6973071.1 unnamed protein product [Tilletia controversa]